MRGNLLKKLLYTINLDFESLQLIEGDKKTFTNYNTIKFEDRIQINIINLTCHIFRHLLYYQ